MKLLVADDDPLSRRLLAALATKWGYAVAEASDGAQALRLLEAEDPPKIVLLDWEMPGPDGLAVCRALRLRRADHYVYVIMLTSRNERDDLVAGMEAGADDFVSKPFHEKELELRLRAGRRIAELEEKLRLTAMTDALTGAWNRGWIRQCLAQQMRRSEREEGAVAVIVADLDRFKEINDRLGHAVGDDVLRIATNRMRSTLRPYDSLGRDGGEEFLVVIPGIEEPAAISLAERVRRALADSPIETRAGSVAVTASFGVAVARASECDADELLRRADEALYRAKRAGRNCVERAGS